MSATLYKRTGKHRQQQTRMIHGKYSFDYVTISLENDEEMNTKFTTKTNESGRLGTKEKDKNAWRNDFMEKLELSVLNKQIQERLKVTAKAQLNWLAPCFRTPNGARNSVVRRRCFCECIGPKFCEVCRRKIEKELSNRVPRIICDLRNSENELSVLERAEYFVTPEPKFSKHLKQASMLYKLEGYQGLQGNEIPDEQGLSIENPKNPAISRSSSYSSLTSSKDGELVNGVIVPSSPQNTPTSPVVFELPNINTPERSPDIPNDQSVLTSIPQLPAISNDHDIIFDQQYSPVSPNDQHILSNIHHSPQITSDIPSDPQNLPIFADIPQTPEIINDEPDIPDGSQMFHITHQLRSINELKADASSPNNNSPSDQNIPPIIPEQRSTSFRDSQRKTVSIVNDENDLNEATLSTSDTSSDASKIDVTQTDSNHTLPKLPHPIEPVLLQLKYINFSIYDYDCNLDK